MRIEHTENPQDIVFRLFGKADWYEQGSDIEAIVLNGKLIYFGLRQNLPITQINDYKMSKDNCAKE